MRLNELCQGGKALWQKVKEDVWKGVSVLQRRGQGCKELPLEMESGLGAASCSGKPQPAWLSSPTALHSSFIFFPSSLSLQFIFLTRSMMLLQTENNRDGVSAKAISELNQS